MTLPSTEGIRLLTILKEYELDEGDAVKRAQEWRDVVEEIRELVPENIFAERLLMDLNYVLSELIK